MACSIKFVRLNDFAADIDVLDLSADGYSLDRDGYFPVVAPIGAKSVHEVLTLKLQGTSKGDLATMTQDIDEKIKQVQWWIDAPGVERYQVWMRVQLENETYPRQAQILNITPPDKLRVFVPEEINNNYIGAYSLGIERTPFWEDSYSYPTTTAKTNIGTIGGTAQLSETINGDVPARLARTIITESSSSDPISTVWLGWKTSRFGNPANFVPVWPLEEASGRDTDTTVVADADGYSGNVLSCSFASDATLIQRALISIGDVMGSNYADQRGIYNVLMRAKVSSGATTVRARMRYWVNIYRSKQVISGNTGYAFYEMGTIKIPAARLLPSYSLQYFNIGIELERIAGAGTCSMDCLVFIPISDGAIKITSSINALPASASTFDVLIASDDSVTSFYQSSGAAQLPLISVPQDEWSLPANSEAPYLVMAAQGIGGSSLPVSEVGTVLDFSYTYIPRFRTLRGSTT